MYKLSLNKFGTFFDLYIFEDSSFKYIESDIEILFKKYENIFSRFKENSELSLVNKENRGDLSPLFLDLFKKNIDLNKLTNGYFNPFINVEDIGYSNMKLNKNFNKIKSIQFDKNYELNGNSLFLKNNFKIDFGGSGKGYFVDYISNYLEKKGIKNFFINFGGDIYTKGKMDNNKLFRIGIENPFLIGEKFGYITLENSSISSSGNYFRNWDIGGKKFHHIINPLNNSNEYEIKMVTIISNKTYFSDSIATAVFNMGIKQAIYFLNEKNIDGLIIGSDAKAYFSKGFIKKYNFNDRY